MRRRLTQVERAMRSLDAPITGPRVGNVMWEGVKASELWSPPTPHERMQVTIGADPHHALYRDYTRRPLTLSEQIDLLVSKT